MIEVSKQLALPVAPQNVWDLLSNPGTVCECVPGATLERQREDGTYDAALIVRFSSLKVTFRTNFTLELDAAAMAGTVTSKGKDTRGGMRVHATMRFKVVEMISPPGSSIFIDANAEVTGRLATVVESGASLVIEYLTKAFSERLASRCAGAIE